MTELLQEYGEKNAMGELGYTTKAGKKVVLTNVAGYPSLDFRTSSDISYSPSDNEIQSVIDEINN